MSISVLSQINVSGGIGARGYVVDSNIFCIDIIGGIFAYSWDGSALTLIDSIDDAVSYRDIKVVGDKIYVACDTDGVRVYDWDGTNIAYNTDILDAYNIDLITIMGNYLVAIDADADHIYVCDIINGIPTNVLHDCSIYSVVDSFLENDGKYLYISIAVDDVYVFEIRDNKLCLVDIKNTGRYYAVYCHNNYVLCAGIQEIYIYKWIDGELTYITKHIGLETNIWAIAMYGNYILVSNQDVTYHLTEIYFDGVTTTELDDESGDSYGYIHCIIGGKGFVTIIRDDSFTGGNSLIVCNLSELQDKRIINDILGTNGVLNFASEHTLYDGLFSARLDKGIMRKSSDLIKPTDDIKTLEI